RIEPEVEARVAEHESPVRRAIEERDLSAAIRVEPPDVAPRREDLRVDVLEVERSGVPAEAAGDWEPIARTDVRERLSGERVRAVAGESDGGVELRRRLRREPATAEERQEPDVAADPAETQPELECVVEPTVEQLRQGEVFGVLELGEKVGRSADAQRGVGAGE